MFNPQPSHTLKTLKMILLGAGYESRDRIQNWSALCQFNVTGWNILSCPGHDI